MRDKEIKWRKCIMEILAVMDKYKELKDYPSYRFLYNALKCSLNSIES